MSKFSVLRNVLYTKQTGPQATGVLFMFHGTGSNADEFKTTWDYLSGSKFQFPHVKFIYPSAPLIHYSFLNEKTTTWFDVSDLAMTGVENEADLSRIVPDINGLIEQEIVSGIPMSRIAFGGFSRGAAMSMHMGYRFATEAAGVVVLSGFIPDSSRLYVDLKRLTVDENIRVPLLLSFHGKQDNLVGCEMGRRTFEKLSKLNGNRGEFVEVPGLDHSLNENECERVYEFINKVIPENLPSPNM